MTNYVPGVGNPNAKLLICAEAPGETEEKVGEPLVGPTGKLARQLVEEETGIHWSETYRTNVVKVRPPDNKLSRLSEIGHSIEEFLPQLYSEINAINPNCILALGATSLHYLTGKTGLRLWRGSILSTLNTIYPKVISTYHPSCFLHLKEEEKNDTEVEVPYTALAYVRQDIRRAGYQSGFKDFKLPSRILQVARGAQDVYEFINMYKKELYCSIDIEVIKAIPVNIGMAFVSHHGLSVPLLQNPGYGNRISKVELAEMWKMVAEVLANSNIRKIGQNFKFDQRQINGPMRMSVNNFYADTMLIAHTLYPEFPQALQFTTSIYTDEPYYKDELKEFNEKKQSFDDLCTYNAKDCCVTLEIFLKQVEELKERGLYDYYFNFRHKLHDFYIDIEREGFNREVNQYREIYIKYTKVMADQTAELFSLLSSPINVNSPKQIATLLYEKLKLPRRKTTGEDDLVALQANHASDRYRYRIIDLILSLRRIQKTISTYLEADLDFDNKLRTNYRINGTETGRTSTTVIKAPVRPFQVGMAFQTITKHGDIGSDIGKMFVPDPGYIFVNVDQKQAEARVVALLSRDFDMLEKYNTMDVHKWTAAFCMEISEDGMTEGERYTGKTARHMGHLGAGKKRFMIELNNGAKRFHIQIPQISEWKAGKILDKFHQLSPNVRGVFHREVEECLDRDATLYSPSGWHRQFFERPGYEMYSEGYAYIPQNSVEYITKRAGLQIKKKRPDIHILLEGHDSLLFMIRETELKEHREIIKEAFELPLDFSICSLPRPSLIIPCEFSIGYNYKELSKWAG